MLQSLQAGFRNGIDLKGILLDQSVGASSDRPPPHSLI